jgi:hypothetical protein
MALEIPEGAVVGEHVESVLRPFEGAPRLVPAVRAVADVGAKERRALVGGHAAGDGEQLIVGKPRDGVERRRHHLDLPVGIEFGQRDVRTLFGRERRHDRPCRGVESAARVREILDPAAAAVRLIDARQERRDHLTQLHEHRLRMRSDLVERVREHPQQERLERLAGAEQADVGAGRRRQQTAQRVERLGANH